MAQASQVRGGARGAQQGSSPTRARQADSSRSGGTQDGARTRETQDGGARTRGTQDGHGRGRGTRDGQHRAREADGRRRAAEAAEFVVDAAAHLPGVPALTARLAPPTSRAIADVIRRPEAMLGRARRLPMAATMLREAVTPILTGRVDDWRAEYAYATGLQAFIYGFPYIYNARLKHDWVTQSKDPAVIPYAAINHFWHASRLMDATYRDGGCPNNDTLYSVAWLDLTDEPVILSHPNMADRYFTFELIGFSSDNFDYVGQRTTGTNAGHFAITGPSWKGKLPPGVKKVKPSPTPWVLVLGRTLVDGAADLPEVRALQAQYKLTPLSKWGKPRAKVPQRRSVYAPVEPAADPLGPWKSLNAMLAENPPPAHHAVLLRQFADLGIGPGLDVDAQPEVVKRALIRAAAVGMPLLRQQFLSGRWARMVNGWRYPPMEEGRFGDDFLKRAADQSLAGITANDPAEAVYLMTFTDSDGRPLSPRGRYELRFTADALPPVDAFWSLTAYTAADMNLIPNAAGRYSVGDRTPGLVRQPNGSLTISLQPLSPGTRREPNWLPTSAQDQWFAILRLYRPRPSVVEAQWKCPPLVKVRSR
ncbi:MAG TPA: DUF1254 domain-containing protein [Streptosporangiaceae bacterium]|nr:DUF1254 domain-containing protein [Streptosporangiaceae bacterium]